MEIKIFAYPRRVLMVLLVGALFLATTSAIIDLAIVANGGKENASTLMTDLSDLFEIYGEGNLTSLFSTGILLIAGLLLLMISAFAHQNKMDSCRQWLVLGLIFILLSIDESVSLHERLGTIGANLLNIEDPTVANYMWLIPGGIFALLVAIGYTRFIINLPKRTEYLVIIAGATFVAGAVLVEIVEGVIASLYSFDSPLIRVSAQIEESLELLGVIVLIYALLDYLAQQLPNVSVTLILGEDPLVELNRQDAEK